MTQDPRQLVGEEQHIGTILISGERNAYAVAALVRDEMPTGGRHVFQESDLAEAVGTDKGDADLHELYEIDFVTDMAHWEEVEEFLLQPRWMKMTGVMLAESLIVHDPVD